MSLLLVTACGGAIRTEAPRPSGEGLCAGLAPLVDEHAEALAESPDERVVITGDRLITGYDAGCATGGAQ